MKLLGITAVASCFGLCLAFTVGCTTKTVAAPAATAPETPAEPPVEDSEADAGVAAPVDTCAPTLKRTKSKCKNESSWIRGVAHFDKAHFAGKTEKPVLRLVLRHAFTLMKGEEEIGGRLHAFKSIPVDAPESGEVPFAIDMCELGTAMWSEENGGFHLVMILDEDGNNDIEEATSAAEATAKSVAGPNELVKMVDVDVSCHAATACLDVTIDCTGEACTKITPMESCAAKTPGCKSDDTFCK